MGIQFSLSSVGEVSALVAPYSVVVPVHHRLDCVLLLSSQIIATPQKTSKQKRHLFSCNSALLL